jgi:glycine/D-amino acid oxidase-like deaminating enzyme
VKPDLIVVGGGIVGCSAAAFAAERGASVLLVEATEIGAGASGRNSGSVQYPFDPILAELHERTLDIYRGLAGLGFDFPAQPAGLLLLTDDLAAARDRAAALTLEAPHLAPSVLTRAELAEVEPILAADLSAVLLETGYPIPPDAATRAMADRAAAAGADVRVGMGVAAVHGDGSGVTLRDGEPVACGAVLVAAGPWTPALVDPSGAWQPLRPTHGVTLQVELGPAARHVLEEGVVHTVNRPVDDPAPGSDLASTFSMVSIAGTSTVGSTFLPSAPDPTAVAPILLDRAARFVPALRDAAIVRARVCIRPQSIDGRPFVGAWPGADRLFVCVGHGPWGISTGPGTAAMVVDAILGARHGFPSELSAAR